MGDLVWTLPAQPNQTARWQEPSGGGGGSQPSLRWVNVATITYADIVAAGNGVPIDLLTLPTDTMVDAYWFHAPVGFDDSGSIDYTLGWLLGSGTPRPLGKQVAVIIPQSGSGQGDDWAGVAGTSTGDTTAGDLFPSVGDGSWYYGPLVLDAATAGPLQIVFVSINGDGTQGEMDIWLRMQDPA